MVLEEEKQRKNVVESYKRAPVSKKVFKMKDIYIF